MSEAWTLRPLFGGAMTAALPLRFVDVSDFRQVPDSQEVFADASSDQSIITEVLDMIADADATMAAEAHFLFLGQDNDATTTIVEQTSSRQLPNGYSFVSFGLVVLVLTTLAALLHCSIRSSPRRVVGCFPRALGRKPCPSSTRAKHVLTQYWFALHASATPT